VAKLHDATLVHNIRALAVGAVERWRDHCRSLSYGCFWSAQTPTKNSKSTDLKHPSGISSSDLPPPRQRRRSCPR
jgi:hypothetical protein